MKTLYLVFFLWLTGSFSLSAQSVYYNHGHDNFLRLEFNKALFLDDFDTRFLSFDSFLNGEFTIGKKNKIGFEIPFNRFLSVADDNSFIGPRRRVGAQLGNIAVAYQIRSLEHPSYFEIKLRLPTVIRTDLNGFVGVFTDYTERLPAVLPSLFSLEGSYTLESKSTQGLYYRFKPGMKLLIPTNDDTIEDNVELLLDINILGGYRNEIFDTNAGITTTSVLSEDVEFNDRVLRQLFFTLTINAGASKPGFIVRMPFGNVIGSNYDLAFGVYFGYTFN